MKTCLIILLLLISKNMLAQHTHFTFIDGNNNDYIITDSTLEYKPISAAQSSSGEYHGGEPKTIEIHKTTYKQLHRLAKKIIKDKRDHTEYRNIGDGVILLGKHAVNFKGKSQLYKDILKLLSELLTSTPEKNE